MPQTLIYYILLLQSVMSIIHELHLENKESTDSNQRNERKKKKKKKETSAPVMILSQLEFLSTPSKSNLEETKMRVETRPAGVAHITENHPNLIRSRGCPRPRSGSVASGEGVFVHLSGASLLPPSCLQTIIPLPLLSKLITNTWRIVI